MLSREIEKLEEAGTSGKILSKFKEGYTQMRERDPNSTLDYVKEFWEKHSIKSVDVEKRKFSSSNAQDTSTSASQQARKPKIEITLESITKMPEWESNEVQVVLTQLENEQDPLERDNKAAELLVEFQEQLEKSNTKREEAGKPKLDLNGYLKALSLALQEGNLGRPTDASTMRSVSEEPNG